MHKCLNPECNKEIPDFLDHCSEDCKTQHGKIKNETKENTRTNETAIKNTKPIEELALIDPNEGTKSKTILKNKALRLIATYPDNLTLKQYASRLCWDISVSFRTALEGYIEPMVEKGILWHFRENLYRINPQFRQGTNNNAT